MSAENSPNGIWLEVADVRLEIGGESSGESHRVLLKGDREHPKPVWWPVAKSASKSGDDIYRRILDEMDKKRVVLARLTCDRQDSHTLHCDAFRFQSAEFGAR